MHLVVKPYIWSLFFYLIHINIYFLEVAEKKFTLKFLKTTWIILE